MWAEGLRYEDSQRSRGSGGDPDAEERLASNISNVHRDFCMLCIPERTHATAPMKVRSAVSRRATKPGR